MKLMISGEEIVERKEEVEEVEEEVDWEMFKKVFSENIRWEGAVVRGVEEIRRRSAEEIMGT